LFVIKDEFVHADVCAVAQHVHAVPSFVHRLVFAALGVSLRKYVTLSRMIAAWAPISIHESAIGSELTG
jgi:hypothetical protein